MILSVKIVEGSVLTRGVGEHRPESISRLGPILDTFAKSL